MKKPSLRRKLEKWEGSLQFTGPPEEWRKILNNILAKHLKKLEEEQTQPRVRNEGNDKISVEINKAETKKTVEKINQGLPWCSSS